MSASKMDEKKATERYPGTGKPDFTEVYLGHPYSYSPQQGYGGGNAAQPGYQSTQQDNKSHQSTVVVTQPVDDVLVVSKYQDNMGLAIFTTVCCFWPLGIFAITRASESSTARASGYYQAAQSLSQKSRLLSLIGIGIGCILLIISIVIVVLVATRVKYYLNHMCYGAM